MGKLYEAMGVKYSLVAFRLREKAARFFREEKGDLVSSLGWMAVMALVLVLIKSIVDGRLIEYANNIFSHLDRVFSS
ncbi:MAG: hypothetical protein FWF99_07655 [Desulfovibrionaceae bacterium]|nr:hypothetical protein [Desulfovibrionaceae bacterium]